MPEYPQRNIEDLRKKLQIPRIQDPLFGLLCHPGDSKLSGFLANSFDIAEALQEQLASEKFHTSNAELNHYFCQITTADEIKFQKYNNNNGYTPEGESYSFLLPEYYSLKVNILRQSWREHAPEPCDSFIVKVSRVNYDLYKNQQNNKIKQLLSLVVERIKIRVRGFVEQDYLERQLGFDFGSTEDGNICLNSPSLIYRRDGFEEKLFFLSERLQIIAMFDVISARIQRQSGYFNSENHNQNISNGRYLGLGTIILECSYFVRTAFDLVAQIINGFPLPPSMGFTLDSNLRINISASGKLFETHDRQGYGLLLEPEFPDPEFRVALPSLRLKNRAIGNTDCLYNAESQYLRCAVNPDGPCEGCVKFKPKSTPDIS